METIGTLPWKLRLAINKDIPALQQLIRTSVFALQADYYSEKQMQAALGPVFGVDRQLIADNTYFLVEKRGEIIGAGGWSKRAASFGSDSERAGDNPMLDMAHDAAKIRAFFVHPDYARRGIGSAILKACEQALKDAGFRKAEMVATLAGEPLYRSFGYVIAESFDLQLRDNLKLPVVRMTKNFENL